MSLPIDLSKYNHETDPDVMNEAFKKYTNRIIIDNFEKKFTDSELDLQLQLGEIDHITYSKRLKHTVPEKLQEMEYYNKDKIHIFKINYKSPESFTSIADQYTDFLDQDIEHLENLIKNHTEQITGRWVKNWKLYVILNFSETSQTSYRLWNPKKLIYGKNIIVEVKLYYM